jgi:hypothetical protein
MFLPLSEKVDNQLILDNFNNIRTDYFNFVSNHKKYFFDYQHSWDLKFGFSTTSLPKNTGYFWQVCPLIYGKHPIPSIFWHEEVEECFTTKMISSFKVKPILAIFSMIEPGGIVKPHRDHDDDLLVGFGYTKTGKETIIKYHLSVDIPNDGECSLTVAGQTRLLNNGDLNPFDETSEHSVVNTSTQRRGALIMSFLRSEIY